MNKKTKRIIAGVLCVVLVIGSAGSALAINEKAMCKVKRREFEWTHNSDIQIISDRIKENRIDELYKASSEKVAEYLADFNFEDGSFNSVDYLSEEKDTWHAAEHLIRLQKMQICANAPQSEYYQDENIKKAISLGAKYWAEKDYVCSFNGWWNDIGVALYIPDILLFGVDDLSPEYKQKLVDILKRNDIENGKVFVGVKEREVNPGGANLTDNVISSLKIAVIENDGSKIMWLRELVERELRPFPTYKFPMHRHDSDGIKEDMSQLMHWHLPYFGGYGEVFTHGVCRYMKFTKDTQYQLRQEAIDNFADSILDGMQFSFRDTYRDINSAGRGVGSPNGTKGSYNAVHNALKLLNDYNCAKRQNEILEALNNRFNEEGTDSGAGGHRFYYESDLSVYNDVNYMASVHHSSNRTRRYEFLNGTNPFGYYLGSGATFYYKNNNQYDGVLALYDWNKIPGTTTRQGVLPNLTQDQSYNKKGNTNKTAGASNGKIGVSYIKTNDLGVKANQAYFMFNDGVVCLGSGVSSNKKENIVTDINQVKILDDVIACSGNSCSNLEIGTNQSGNFDYIYHDGISYITGNNVNVDLQHKDGDWKTTDTRQPSKPVADDILNIYIDHGVKPKNASYDYTVLMNTDIEKTNSYILNPTLVTVQNDNDIQAVYDSENDVLQAVFYGKGSLELPNGETLSVDHACVCILERIDGNSVLTISSNDFKEHSINAKVNDKEQKIDISKKSTTYNF